MSDQTIFRVTFSDGSSCHYGVESLARAVERQSGGIVETITVRNHHAGSVTALHMCADQLLHDGAPVDPEHPKRVALDAAAESALRGTIDIDDRYAGRLAMLLECMLIDPHSHWNDAAYLLDEYKAEWEKVNPQPPTFLGEPMLPECKA